MCSKVMKMFVLCFYKYKLLLQYGDLEKYIHIISDNKHIFQTKIKKTTKTNNKIKQMTISLLFAHDSVFGILH